jgi:mono/diheme cytochrome c family protein
MKMRATAFTLALALITVSAAAQKTLSTRQGVYTDSQAAEGAQLYTTRCAMCHGRMLEGSYDIPGLGDRFIALWSGASLAELHDYLGRAMPQFAPGSLTPDETSKIIAYLLRENGLPSGRTILPAEPKELGTIMVDAATPAPPQPGRR